MLQNSLILKESNLFKLKKPPRLTEAMFEDQIVSQASEVFFEWTIIKFKVDVSSDSYDNTSRPDLAFIHREYKNWCIVEVETTNHDLGRHVIPQVTTFMDGKYGSTHAKYIQQKFPSLFESNRLNFLINNIQPEVFVITERYLHNWHRTLNNEGCKYFAFEPHENQFSEWCFYLKGDSPSVNKTLLSYCNSSKGYSFLKCLQLENPYSLSNLRQNNIKIIVNNVLTRWKVFNVESTSFIVPIDNIGINLEKKRWALYQDEGLLSLELVK